MKKKINIKILPIYTTYVHLFYVQTDIIDGVYEDIDIRESVDITLYDTYEYHIYFSLLSYTFNSVRSYPVQ